MIPKAARAARAQSTATGRAPIRTAPPSGVRDVASASSTRPPASRGRFTWFSKIGLQGAPPPEVATLIHDLLDRFEAGDYRGALAASDTLLEPGHIVVPVAFFGQAGARDLDARALHILQLTIARPTLEELVETSGLPLLEALRTVCELLERGLLGLAASA